MKTLKEIFKIADLKEKRATLLENTLAYYSKNPKLRRSISKEGGCSYFPESSTSDGCAIGRLIGKDLGRRLDNKDSGFVASAAVFDALPKRVCDFGQEFLSALQALHDDNSYWTEEGLSKRGSKAVEKIQEIYL